MKPWWQINIEIFTYITSEIMLFTQCKHVRDWSEMLFKHRKRTKKNERVACQQCLNERSFPSSWWPKAGSFRNHPTFLFSSSLSACHTSPSFEPLSKNSWHLLCSNFATGYFGLRTRRFKRNVWNFDFSLYYILIGYFSSCYCSFEFFFYCFILQSYEPHQAAWTWSRNP